MIGVIILHINNPAIGEGIDSVKVGSINQFLVYYGESLFIIGCKCFYHNYGIFHDFHAGKKRVACDRTFLF